MSFYRISGTSNVKELPSAASTALVANGMVTLASGVLAKSNSTDLNLAGICLQTRATTDSDFATAKPVLVDMLKEDSEVLADVTNGSLLTTSVGLYFDLSSTAGLLIDFGTASSSEGNFLCVAFISATQGRFVLAGSALSRPSA